MCGSRGKEQEKTVGKLQKKIIIKKNTLHRKKV